MSSIREALLAIEPTPPDEVKPRRAVVSPPVWNRFSVVVAKPPGCTAWRASVFVHVDELGAPSGLEASFGTRQDAWDAALLFIENAFRRPR